MNKVFLIGNLTKDPELKTTPNGNSVCTFSMAVQRGFGEKKQTDFLNIVTWRGLADICAKYLRKGKQVAVVGSIATRSYEAADGGKRYVTEIIADDTQFLGSKQSGENANESNEENEDEIMLYSADDDEELPF